MSHWGNHPDRTYDLHREAVARGFNTRKVVETRVEPGELPGFLSVYSFSLRKATSRNSSFQVSSQESKGPTKPQLTSTAIYGNDRTSVDRHVRISHSFLRSSLALRSFLFSTRTQLKSFINYKSSPRSPRPFVASFGTGGFQSMTE